MWIVRLALRRPYTFVCMAILMLLLGVTAIARTPVDIFPAINIPLVTAVWYYGGLAPEEMERRITTIAERQYTNGINGIEHIESESLNGAAVIRVYLQPDASFETAIAQVTASSQSATRQMPPGATPPYILRFNATDVPILQVAVGSRTISEQELNDLSNNIIRNQLVTAQGAQVPTAYGGRSRQIMVDIDPQQLYAKGLSPSDVSNAINAQNVILPAGTAKMGEREYQVRLNSSPDVVALFNDLPIKQVNGATVYIKDVAQVRDAFGVQTNIVRQNGRRGTYLSVMKSGNASTLDVVDRVKAMLGRIKSLVPPAVDIELLADQSLFVRASINGVIREGVIAACLTALMILLFLGSWRSTFIVAISIPLSVLTSIICLAALGQTINVMTLGGLALAVGILVDDATVEIENIHRNMAQGKEITTAILDGASQIALPAFVSTLSICIVFVPIFFLSGPAAALFRPLAMAVVFAILASYLLSRTLIPTMVRHLLEQEAHLYATGQIGDHAAEHASDAAHLQGVSGLFWRINHKVERGFHRIRERYSALLTVALDRPKLTTALFVLFVAGSALLIPFIGEDFFPLVDGGQFRLHIRAPAGTRVEETELVFASVERTIRRIIPPSDVGMLLDNIGLAGGSTGLATGDAATIGPADGQILVSLAAERKGKTADYVAELRDSLVAEYPDVDFFFQPADIVNQVLNLGLPAPVDIQVSGQDKAANYQVAKKIALELSHEPGAADVRVHQVTNAPELRFDVDRVRAEQIGLTQRDVASNLLISLSSSGQTAPNFWLNTQNGVQYAVSVQTPQYKMSDMESLTNTPVSVAGASQPQLFGNLATGHRLTTMADVSHYNILPVFDVYASAEGRDLGSLARAVDRITKATKLPRGTSINVRGQIQSMRQSFLGLGLGVIAAIVLVYILLVVNFQSWLDPLIIVMALPGALAGILWMLFVTRTTFSVPSLMGAIMAMGVATANSILLVTFADDVRREGRNAREAALEAGFTRLRPVVMTALAMIIGMLPMALGLGEGGEQNAPLGRAVIGGLLVATIFTLGFVPIVYSVLRTAPPAEEPVLPAEHGTASLTGHSGPSPEPAGA